MANPTEGLLFLVFALLFTALFPSFWSQTLPFTSMLHLPAPFSQLTFGVLVVCVAVVLSTVGSLMSILTVLYDRKAAINSVFQLAPLLLTFLAILVFLFNPRFLRAHELLTIFAIGFPFLQSVLRLILLEITKDPFHIGTVLIAYSILLLSALVATLLPSGQYQLVLALTLCNGAFYIWSVAKVISEMCNYLGMSHWWSIVPDAVTRAAMLQQQ